MKVIGKNQKGLLVQIDYSEIRRLIAAESPIDEGESFIEAWKDILNNFPVFNDLNYYVDKIGVVIDKLKDNRKDQ